jgi:glycosyltransferase involved in cell wall biosynthesis
VLEAASRGLPVVATEVLREELDWRLGQEMFAAAADDPAAFAAAVVTLYRDEVLWLSVREGALLRLRQENARESYANALGTVLMPQ